MENQMDIVLRFSQPDGGSVPTPTAQIRVDRVLPDGFTVYVGAFPGTTSLATVFNAAATVALPRR